MRRKNIVTILLNIVLIVTVISSIILTTGCSTESDNLSAINQDLQRQLTESMKNVEELSEELNIVKDGLLSSDLTNEKLSDDNENLNKEIVDLNEQIAQLESSFEELTSSYDLLQSDYTALNTSYQDSLRELFEKQEVQPLQYFASLGLLEDWIDENIEPYQSTLDPQIDFKEACKIVEKGIQDGYWIGISFRHQNTLLIIECSAIAGDRAYTFYPFGGNITLWPVYK